MDLVRVFADRVDLVLVGVFAAAWAGVEIYDWWSNR